MTSADSHLAEVVRIYSDLPLRDGDAVLLLDDEVCLEIEGLADAWGPAARDTTVHVVRRSAHRVQVLIARQDARLEERDYQLWRDLHADLRDTADQLMPVRALPAA